MSNARHELVRRSIVLGGTLTVLALAAPAHADEPPAPAPEVTPAAPPAAAPATTTAPKKGGSGPALGLNPDAPQVGGLVTTTSEAPAAAEEPETGEWKFDVTGYFRAPLRFSWGPPTTPDPYQQGVNAGTQIRTPPLVPDANYIDWRYTNSMVGPWTELNFHYGNDRVKATVQIASYNITDSGYRRLEANLGINEAFLSMTYPEFINENSRLTLIAGAYTNRYGAAGRYDAGRYETYLFGRTHTAGLTVTEDYDVDDWTGEIEGGFGGKLEPIPFYGPPVGNGPGNANQNLPAWEPYPGPVPQESTFVAHGHLGAVYKKEVIIGAHYIYVFANDNERAGSYQGGTNPSWDGPGNSGMIQMNSPARQPGDPKPSIAIYGADVKLLGGVLGDGYLGYSHLAATNALYLADAIEVLHSFGGWQLHDNYFGAPGGVDPVTGSIDSVELQYSFSFGQLFHYPQAFWGDGPDIIGTIFGMFNHVNAPDNPMFSLNKLKFGTEWTYSPLPWLGVGGRYDVVEPNLSNSGESFSVLSPRIIFRTAFVTHEQVMIQYSRYFYGNLYAAGDVPAAGFMSGSQFPYNSQLGAANLGVDKNAAQIAAIIWF
ncbi:MAG TPA: hypothetical protein VHO06_23060 [Polyangia bacterium]|nr:hypothetical protein [Polyangia bacterium]